MDNFSKSTNSTSKNDKLVYYNENTQLNDIIKTKELLITEQGNHKIELINYDKIIKESSVTINIEFSKYGGYIKYMLPLLFILMFVFVRFFIGFYKRQNSLSGN